VTSLSSIYEVVDNLYFNQIRRIGGKKKIGFNLIKLFWKSGFDGMLRRGKLCGDQLWNLSMGV
jgi:hypothetical protein